MRWYRSLFGLLIMLAVIIAGCSGTTGNKKLNIERSEAMDNYYTKVDMLKDLLADLKNDQQPSKDIGLEEYEAWLASYKKKLDACLEMYGQVATSRDAYSKYINERSKEYANITSTEKLLMDEILGQEENYKILEKCYQVALEKRSAESVYNEKGKIAVSMLNDLYGYARSNRANDINEFKVFIEGFQQRTGDYESCCNEALDAAKNYKQYLDPGSEEYGNVTATEQAFMSSLSDCKNASEKYQAEYDKYRAMYDEYEKNKPAMSALSSDYSEKVNKASQSKSDLEKYRSEGNVISTVNRKWLDGYKAKLDIFIADANAAIDTGDQCLRYIAPASDSYKAIKDNEKAMLDTIAKYEEDYKKLDAKYKVLHPLGEIGNL
jgi:inorganic pyrophosphatase